MQSTVLILVALTLLHGGVKQARGGTITTTADTSALDLATALISGGAGGISVTGETLSTNTSGNVASSGIYTTSGSNNYNLTGRGIVISSGNVATDGTSGPFIRYQSYAFGTNATTSQFNLLQQVSPASSSFHDVTELDITFKASPTTNAVYFNAVFASAEYPTYVGQYIDGFGLFLNGTNIAFAGGQSVNIDSTLMVNTGYPTDGGVDGTKYQTTPLGGLLVYKGNPVVTYSGSVTPGSTDNTLTFIVGDANDYQLDTAAFIEGLGNAPPSATPEPSSLALLGMAGGSFAGYFGWRRRRPVTA